MTRWRPALSIAAFLLLALTVASLQIHEDEDQLGSANDQLHRFREHIENHKAVKSEDKRLPAGGKTEAQSAPKAPTAKGAKVAKRSPSNATSSAKNRLYRVIRMPPSPRAPIKFKTSHDSIKQEIQKAKKQGKEAASAIEKDKAAVKDVADVVKKQMKARNATLEKVEEKVKSETKITNSSKCLSELKPFLDASKQVQTVLPKFQQLIQKNGVLLQGPAERKLLKKLTSKERSLGKMLQKLRHKVAKRVRHKRRKWQRKIDRVRNKAKKKIKQINDKYKPQVMITGVQLEDRRQKLKSLKAKLARKLKKLGYVKGQKKKLVLTLQDKKQRLLRRKLRKRMGKEIHTAKMKFWSAQRQHHKALDVYNAKKRAVARDKRSMASLRTLHDRFDRIDYIAKQLREITRSMRKHKLNAGLTLLDLVTTEFPKLDTELVQKVKKSVEIVNGIWRSVKAVQVAKSPLLKSAIGVWKLVDDDEELTSKIKKALQKLGCNNATSAVKSIRPANWDELKPAFPELRISSVVAKYRKRPLHKDWSFSDAELDKIAGVSGMSNEGPWSGFSDMKDKIRSRGKTILKLSKRIIADLKRNRQKPSNGLGALSRVAVSVQMAAQKSGQLALAMKGKAGRHIGRLSAQLSGLAVKTAQVAVNLLRKAKSKEDIKALRLQEKQLAAEISTVKSKLTNYMNTNNQVLVFQQKLKQQPHPEDNDLQILAKTSQDLYDWIIRKAKTKAAKIKGQPDPFKKWIFPTSVGPMAKKQEDKGLEFLRVNPVDPAPQPSDTMKLDPKLAIDPVIMHQAKKVDGALEGAHEHFIRQQAKDCKGPLCALH